MKITVAPDSLKESLSAARAAQAIARGLRRADPGVSVVAVPMADGGEGTLDAVVEAAGGRLIEATVSDPLGRPVRATWGMCADGATAVVEMATAGGLELLEPHERDPMLTSTRGVGELIRAALDAGAEHVIVGIGGSATVDGGTGMASALGVRFLDRAGRVVEDCSGGRLADICDVDVAGLHPRAAQARVTVACDVVNPLTGPTGAARTYAPQKGATPAQVEELERGLQRLAGVIRERLGVDVQGMPGSGAAGGLGAGLVAFLGGAIRSGAETVMEAVGLREKMAGSDLVVTAEGRLDGQSAYGKVVAAVASAAAEQGMPVVVLAGSLGPGWEEVLSHGVTAALPIADGPMELSASLARAEELLERTAESLMRVWNAAGGHKDA